MPDEQCTREDLACFHRYVAASDAQVGAMLESLEGKAGLVRYKPPLPAIEGLFGKPTVVNNVVTLASVPNIVNLGGERYAGMGVNRSTGTLAFQLGGNIRRGGLVERAFGVTLRELIEDYGGGTASGRPVKAVQVTSSVPEEGKTTLAIIIARELGVDLGRYDF